MRVRDAMTHGIIGVRDTASLAEAVETMLRAGISALCVFDERKALVGILSEGDLLRRGELGTEKRRPRWLESLLSGGRLAHAYAHEHGRTAAEVMTREVVTIDEDAPLSEAVDAMIRRRVKRLPVVRGGSVIGVVSRSDLLKRLYVELRRDCGAPFRRRDLRRHPEGDRVARLGPARFRPRFGQERRSDARGRDRRRTPARGPAGDRREHPRGEVGARPARLGRAQFRHAAVGGGRAAEVIGAAASLSR